jgi:hypothetical protein
MSPRSVQLAAAAAAVTAAWLAYKIYRAVWCPPALRKLPAIPIPTFFRLLNLPFNVRHGALKRILDGTKAVRVRAALLLCPSVFFSRALEQSCCAFERPAFHPLWPKVYAKLSVAPSNISDH